MNLYFFVPIFKCNTMIINTLVISKHKEKSYENVT